LNVSACRETRRVLFYSFLSKIPFPSGSLPQIFFHGKPATTGNPGSPSFGPPGLGCLSKSPLFPPVRTKTRSLPLVRSENWTFPCFRHGSVGLLTTRQRLSPWLFSHKPELTFWSGWRCVRNTFFCFFFSPKGPPPSVSFRSGGGGSGNTTFYGSVKMVTFPALWSARPRFN